MFIRNIDLFSTLLGTFIITLKLLLLSVVGEEILLQKYLTCKKSTFILIL